jgi:hypothetical protein
MGTAKRASAHTISTNLARPLDVPRAELTLALQLAPRLPVENIGSSQIYLHLRVWPRWC